MADVITRNLIMKKKDFEQVKKMLDTLGNNIFDYVTIAMEDSEVIVFNVEKQSIIEILRLNRITHGFLRADRRDGKARYEGLHNGEIVEYNFSVDDIIMTVKVIVEGFVKVVETINNIETEEDSKYDEESENLSEKEEFFKKIKDHKVILGFRSFDELGQFLNLWEDRLQDVTPKEFVEHFGKLKYTLENE